MRNPMRWAVAPLAVLALAACNDGEATTDGAAAEPSSRTLAATVAGDGDLDTLEGVVTNAGLASVLEGTGPYTVFAPVDDAFGALGGDADFTDSAMRAQGVALLRGHIVPGALTRQDILAAIEDGGDRVQMRTMADGLLTFTRDGDVIVVGAGDGVSARLTGDESLASNGVIQPMDGVLLSAEPVG